MDKLKYVIVEIANSHDGEEEKFLHIVDSIKSLKYPNLGIKFQVFHPDEIALPDYESYELYQELYFSESYWKNIISKCSEFCDVWIDVFDAYSVKIIAQNFEKICGIKLQASVLHNLEVFELLQNLNLRDLKIIINVSGFTIDEVNDIVNRFKILNSKELILQAGFQDYPTKLQDTGLNKIAILRTVFPDLKVCFADHLSSELSLARDIPVWAGILGCVYIEKHFCIDRNNTKYDTFSALEPAEFQDFLDKLLNFKSAYGNKFISDAEIAYLAHSYQAPVLKVQVPKGSLIGLTDLIYRRTDQSGLTWLEIQKIQKSRKILNKEISEKKVITEKDFINSRIAVVVACRMKSSRLKNKAILPIRGISSVERCLLNCLDFPYAEKVILATSNLEDDAILEKYNLNGQVPVTKGDPVDVISRYLDTCKEHGIDIIIRVTADCPVVSPEIAKLLIDSHFLNGADFTYASSNAVGTSPEIYNVESLERVLKLIGKADYSEYMTWYMKNNPDIFKINDVRLPEELMADFRLTLDYEEDLLMFEKLYEVLEKESLKPNLINVIDVLNRNPDIAKINSGIAVSYKTDKELIDKLNEVTKINKLGRSR